MADKPVMLHRQRIIFTFYLVLLSLFASGCIDKAFKPSVELEIAQVDPYELYATATDSASLPTTSISVTNLTSIPCNLESYSISYFTKYNDPVPGLSVVTTPVERKVDAEGTLSVTIKPYTTKVVELFELSCSDISPLSAKINLLFKDYNSNHVSKEAHCLLYKPD